MSTVRGDERDDRYDRDDEDTAAPPATNEVAFPTLLREWLSREEDLKNLTAAIKEQRSRIKVLKALITERMKSTNTGKLDIPARGSVLIQPQKPKKATLNKKYLLTALTEYFKGDAEAASMCVHYIELHRPTQKGGEKLIFDPVRTSVAGSVVGSVVARSTV